MSRISDNSLHGPLTEDERRRHKISHPAAEPKSAREEHHLIDMALTRGFIPHETDTSAFIHRTVTDVFVERALAHMSADEALDRLLHGHRR